MKLNISQFGRCLVLIALTTTALAAADSPTSSAEKARQAISTLQSGAPAEEKAMACKRLAVYGQADAVPAKQNWKLTDVACATASIISKARSNRFAQAAA